MGSLSFFNPKTIENSTVTKLKTNKVSCMKYLHRSRMAETFLKEKESKMLEKLKDKDGKPYNPLRSVDS